MPDAWQDVWQGKPLLEQDLSLAAAELLRECQGFRIWLFSGELGSGKTTLIKAIGKVLNVEGEMNSPTFSIVNEYTTRSEGTIYHFDFYRIDNEQEAFDIGTDEYFESGNYCFVEWPGKIPSLIPPERVEVKIIPLDRDHRKIQFVKT